MKKTGFIIGSIEIILGFITLFITSTIKELLPQIAKICFMFNTGEFFEGDYSPDFWLTNALAICLCLVGILTCVYFVYIKKE